MALPPLQRHGALSKVSQAVSGHAESGIESTYLASINEALLFAKHCARPRGDVTVNETDKASLSLQLGEKGKTVN